MHKRKRYQRKIETSPNIFLYLQEINMPLLNLKMHILLYFPVFLTYASNNECVIIILCYK